MTRDELENALESVLNKRARIDADVHHDHHESIKQRIEAEKKARRVLRRGNQGAYAVVDTHGLL